MVGYVVVVPQPSLSNRVPDPIPMYGGRNLPPHHQTVLRTPAWRPPVQLSSDTIYVEIAADSIGEVLSPTRLHSTSDTNCKPKLLPVLWLTSCKSEVLTISPTQDAKVKVKSLSRIRLFATPWTVAYQASLSMGFSRQEYWSGLPFPSPGDLPNPGIEPGSPALEADALTSEPPGKPRNKSKLLTLLLTNCKSEIPMTSPTPLDLINFLEQLTEPRKPR